MPGPKRLPPLSQLGFIRIPKNPRQRKIDPSTGYPYKNTVGGKAKTPKRHKLSPFMSSKERLELLLSAREHPSKEVDTRPDKYLHSHACRQRALEKQDPPVRPVKKKIKRESLR